MFEISQSFAERTQMVIVMFIPFLIAVIFHEFAHGWTAKRWGDNTAEASGRLTLNPVPHIDVIGTLVLPLIVMFTGTPFLFGWAKPVPINPARFKKYRAGLFWVSFAGPGMNVLLALFSAILYFTFGVFSSQSSEAQSWTEPLQLMTYTSVSLNFALAIFNLLPLPPLDGSKIIESVLSYEATKKYEAVAQYSFWILLALMFTGALSILAIPIRFLTHLTLGSVGALFSLLGMGG